MERAELERLVSTTGVAVKIGGYVFLRDPQWTPAQRAEFSRLAHSKIENPNPRITKGWLGVPTGGTGGGVKFARHDVTP